MKIKKDGKKNTTDGFRLRGSMGSRLETLTDTIFGFSITLLVISSNVPQTYVELQASMYSFLGFVLCTLLILSIWNSHKVYFLRYGLRDRLTGALNSCLLFILLFYIYPLKYLFSYLGTVIYAKIKLSLGDSSKGLLLAVEGLKDSALDGGQWSDIMVRFGFGLSVIYLIFLLMYLNALRSKKELALNRRETYITRTSAQTFGILLTVTLLSISIVLIFGGSASAYSGLVYLLIPVLLPIHRKVRSSRYKKSKHLRRQRKIDKKRAKAEFEQISEVDSEKTDQKGEGTNEDNTQEDP